MTNPTTPDPRAAFRELLDAHGLGHFDAIFAEHGIDADVLPDLTDGDLREMGLSIGDRKRIAKLRDILAAAPGPEVEKPQPDAERRQITVLFADLVGSTPLSVQLDPEDMRTVIRAFHAAVEAAVSTYGGYVAQHLGDGAVVYFGWPTAHEDDAERAVRAGLELVAKVASTKTPAPTPIQTRVGIATGQVVVGDLVQNLESLERPVIGETPNLAARLEGLAEPGGIVISPTTRRMVGHLFDVTDLGPQQLKGFAAPIHAWRVDGASRVTSRFAALRGEGLSPFVGRELETRLLEDAWASAVQGNLRVAHLVGEAGIGKSRLVRWMRELVATSGGAEQVYYCSPYHGGSAFYPLIQHIEVHADIRTEDDAGTRWGKLREFVEKGGLAVESDLPILAKLLQVPPPTDFVVPRLEPIQEKEIVLSGAVRRLTELASRQPMLVVVEDLHWSDPSSNELLERMMTGGAGHPVFFLVCYRPGYEPFWPTDGHVKLELGRLSPDACAQIVSSLVAAQGVHDTLIERIVGRTDGVPLFVEELTKTMLEAAPAAGSGPQSGGGDLLEHSIPETLQDSLLARLDRLGSVKRVAQVAACVGREFGRPLLHRVSGLDDATLDGALSRLVESNLIRARHVGGETRYLFRHALVQEAAYESLLKSTRAQIHGRIAQALETEGSGTAPEILAYHFNRAGVPDREADCWLQAGQRALSTTAFLEAIQHFTAGLEAVAKLPEPDPGRELLLEVLRAVPLTLTRGWAAEEVGAAYRRAHELCHVLGDSPETFPTLVGVFTYHLVRGEFRYAYELAISNEAVAAASGDPELIMEAAHDRGTSSHYMGRFDEALTHLTRVTDMYDTARHAHHKFLYNKLPGPTADVHAIIAHAVRGDQTRASELYARARRQAEEGDHAFTRVWVETGQCIALLHFHELEALATHARGMIEESRELGFPNWLAQGMAWAGWAKAASGAPEEGVAMIREGLGIWKMTGARLMLPFLNVVLIDALIMAGALEAAEESYVSVVDLMEDTGEEWCAAEAHRLGAKVARARLGVESLEAKSRFDRALHAARAGRAYLHELNLMTDLAQAYLDAGKPDAARDVLGPAAAPFDGREAPVFQEARAILAAAGS